MAERSLREMDNFLSLDHLRLHFWQLRGAVNDYVLLEMAFYCDAAVQLTWA
jgi:hypothetical protein